MTMMTKTNNKKSQNPKRNNRLLKMTQIMIAMRTMMKKLKGHLSENWGKMMTTIVASGINWGCSTYNTPEASVRKSKAARSTTNPSKTQPNPPNPQNNKNPKHPNVTKTT